jgi:hypothetical protein
MDSFKALLEARIQQAIAAKRKSPDCEEWSPSQAQSRGDRPKTARDCARQRKTQGRRRSMTANGLASPDLKLAYALR